MHDRNTYAGKWKIGIAVIIMLAVPVFQVLAQTAPDAGRQSTAPQNGFQSENPQQTQPQNQQQTAPVSDKELQAFSTAIMNVQTLESQMEQDIQALVGQSSLSPGRFMEIYQSRETLGSGDPQGNGADPNNNAAPNANSAPDNTANITPAEQQEFDSLVAKITEMQTAYETRMEDAVKSSGLQVERFNDILNQAETDPTLMNRLTPYLSQEPSPSAPAPDNGSADGNKAMDAGKSS